MKIVTSCGIVAFTLAALVAVGVASRAPTASATPGAVLPTRGLGEPANDYPHGEACASRVAIDITFGSVCSDLCVTDDQCPSNWKCKTIEQGNGEDIGVCFPLRVQAERES